MAPWSVKSSSSAGSVGPGSDWRRTRATPSDESGVGLCGSPLWMLTQTLSSANVTLRGACPTAIVAAT